MLSHYRLILVTSLVALVAVIAGCQLRLPTPAEDYIPLIVDAAPNHAGETLEALLNADPPERDLEDVARRLLGINVSPSQPSTSKQGDVESFWYRDGGNESVRTTAVLAYQSDMLNFWIEEGVRVSQRNIEKATTTLENEIFPTTRAFFGVETQPGIDGDLRINVLNLANIGGDAGSTTLGYFQNSDQYSAEINPTSNEREIFYMSLEQLPVASDKYYEVIAHEFQHMVHSNTDRNEPSWADEGLSELSAHVNGYENRGTVAGFSELPDTQLNDWAIEPAHYGAGFLFTAYFLDRYGEDAMKAVIASEKNGFNGFSEVLQQVDTDTDINQFFADWAVTNYVESVDSAESPYTYQTIELNDLSIAQTVDDFPANIMSDVHQYGVDYIKIESDQPVTVDFRGSQQVQLMDGDPYSGDYFVATYPADRSDMTLTRGFDLSSAAGVTTTLSFQTWYRIEKGWDYGYVLASDDDGASWTMLNSIYMTTADPNGNNYGLGLTGKSGVKNDDSIWAENIIDLTDYAGKQILLRFEYITDDAVTEDGWALDDIAIEAIDYFEDFESGLGGWEAAGFIRHTNILPQTYIVQAIYTGANGVDVQRLVLADDQSGSMQLTLSKEQSEVVLTISGNTPITTKRAGYEIDVSAE